MVRDKRLLANAAALAVPSVLLCAWMAYFLVHDVPRIVENERALVRREHGATAAALRSSELSPDFVWEYRKGIVAGDAERWSARFPSNMTWKAWKPLGRHVTANMWGTRPAKDGTLVWTRAGGKILGKETDVVETDLAAIFWCAGLAAIALVLAMTFISVYTVCSYMKARDDFLAATAHDLTTPIVGMRRLIGVDDAEARLLNERMLRIVENIISFLRLGGKRRYSRSAVDLVSAYREAYALMALEFRDLFGGEDVALEAPAEPGAVTATADGLAVVQILWNLLGNELKYAAPHSRVKARVFASGGFGCVEISDFGPGMKRRDRARAFNRYWRAATVLKSGRGGFGIGLCASHEAATGMGGSLELTPNKPNGCVFTLRLPLAEAHAR